MSNADYDQVVFVPAVAHALETHEGLCLYYEVAPDFFGISGGAMCEEFRVGPRDLTRWKRIAVVTVLARIGPMVHLFGLPMSGASRVFSLAQATEACAWLVDER